MEKKENTPLWVFLAFSSINTRRGALILIWVCIIFSLYCLPWPVFFPEQQWVKMLFLIDDWSWFAMMIPLVIWYWLSLKWIDKNTAWES